MHSLLHTPDMSIGQRIKDRRKGRKVSQARLAEALGTTQATVARWEQGKYEPSYETLEQIGDELEISPGWLAFGDGLDTRMPKSVHQLPVVGIVEAGAWREAAMLDESAKKITFVPHPKFNADDQVAFEVRGESCNEVVRDGDHVVAVPYEKMPGGIEALINQSRKPLVVIQRQRAGLVEATLKELRATAHGLELWPRSAHPDHQEKIQLDENGDTEEVSITHIVVQVIASYI